MNLRRKNPTDVAIFGTIDGKHVNIKQNSVDKEKYKTDSQERAPQIKDNLKKEKLNCYKTRRQQKASMAYKSLYTFTPKLNPGSWNRIY